MKIDYKKFSSYSEPTQQEVIAFSQSFLYWTEMFDSEKKGEFKVYDFEKGNFDLQKLAGQRDKFQEVFGKESITMSHSPLSGWGPPNMRRLTVDLEVKYNLDIPRLIREFLQHPSLVSTETSSKLRFNNHTIFYGDTTYKLQTGTDGNKRRLKLFVLLWKNRKQLNHGIFTRKGLEQTAGYYAKEVDLIVDAKNFARHSEAKKKFSSLKKGLNRCFRQKGIPLRIEGTANIQLIERTK